MITKEAACEVILETLADIAACRESWRISAIYSELKERIMELPEEEKNDLTI